jgi:hypothetical protein
MPQVRFSAEGVNDFTARYEGKKCRLCGALLTTDDWYKTRLSEFPKIAPPICELLRRERPWWIAILEAEFFVPFRECFLLNSRASPYIPEMISKGKDHDSRTYFSADRTFYIQDFSLGRR